ncbi:MAG: N-acetylneuraminate synthase family protein [Bacteroidota bacterium]
MENTVTLRNGRVIGGNAPTYIIAEIGINHNGSLDIAKQLIDAAARAGCDAVKFQKRTPELCVPEAQRSIERDTPWGRMTYMDYRYRVEFEQDEYEQIDAYAREKGIDWFASCWDENAVEFLEQFNPVMYKSASASLTDISLLKKKKGTGLPLIMSTGMSTKEEIDAAVEAVGKQDLILTHSTSTYPCPPEELNLRMIHTLKDLYNVPVGYSGHETGLATTYAAAALGAAVIERHFTLDRAMWGSDQAASVEPDGMRRLVSKVRDIELALGDGVKKVYDSEVPVRKKLRRV